MSKMMAETLKMMYKSWDKKKVTIGIQIGTTCTIEADLWILQNQGDEKVI